MEAYRVQVSALMKASTLLLAHGVEPAEILSRLDLPIAMVLDPEAWVDRTMGFRFGEEVSRALSDRFIGVHTAELNQLNSLGPWGNIICAADTLEHAFSRAATKVDLIATGLETQMSYQGRTAEFTMRYIGRLEENPLQFVEANLTLVAMILKAAPETVGMQVCFPHEAPADCSELERIFGPDLIFGADRAAIRITRDALTLPLSGFSAASNATPTEAEPVDGSTPYTTPPAVMRALKQIICYERPTALAIADSLNINIRTMQRHLAAWGFTYEMVLEEFRRSTAFEYLREGKHNITTIAFLLGYSDSAHFTRACRRWTGQCPRQLVSALRAEKAPSTTPGVAIPA